MVRVHWSASCLLSFWEGLGVGSWSRSMRKSERRLFMNRLKVGYSFFNGLLRPSGRFDTQNFSRLALGDHFERPAADFAIGGETL